MIYQKQILASTIMFFIIISICTGFVKAEPELINVTETDYSVIVDNGVLEVEILKSGVQVRKWYIKDLDLDLAINSGKRFLVLPGYPLWDLFTQQQPPGFLAMFDYAFLGAKILDNKAILQFRITFYNTELGNFTVYKNITFYYGEYYIDLETTVINIGNKPFISKASHDNVSSGYSLAWCSVIGGDRTNDWQVWMEDNKTVFIPPDEKKRVLKHFVSGKIRLYGLMDLEENNGGLGIIIPYNDTVFLQLEYGKWGTEVRAEFPPIVLEPGKHVKYKFRVYGGPLNREFMVKANPYLGKLYDLIETASQRLSYSAKIATDNAIYKLGDEVNCNITLTYEGEGESNISLKIMIINSLSGEVFERTFNATVEPKSKNYFTYSFTPQKEGAYIVKINIYKGDFIVASSENYFVVINPVNKVYISFVWNLHQPLNYYSNGTFYGSWPFYYVWNSEFKPYYEKGAYTIHAEILKKYPDVKFTYHLSPSLLWQWYLGLAKGVEIIDPNSGNKEKISPNDPRMEKIRETLEAYIDLSKRKQIEILTSYFAYPLAGYIVSNYGWNEILNDELKAGINITMFITGYKPDGMWTPEMGFDMKLIPIMASNNITYTVLDGRYHFLTAEGPGKKTLYEPYILQFKNYSIAVFFRDQYLSNLISTKLNKAENPYGADRNARKLIYEIALRKLKDVNNVKIIVIALNGIDWMVSSQTVSTTPIFLEKLCSYLEQGYGKNVIETLTLKEALNMFPPEGTLVVPSASWFGKWEKWTAKDPRQKKMWDLAVEAYRYLEAYRLAIGENRIYEHIEWMFFHTIDSDFYSDENIFEQHVYSWAKAVKEAVIRELNSTIGNVEAYIRDKTFIISVENLSNETVNAALKTILLRNGSVIFKKITLAPGKNEINMGPPISGNVSVSILFSLPGKKYLRVKTFRFNIKEVKSSEQLPYEPLVVYVAVIAVCIIATIAILTLKRYKKF